MTLGETIVRQLRLETSVDTLSRWMAHHLADLLIAAETPSPDQAETQRHCRELVMTLWESRSIWPTGWPPTGTATFLAALYLSSQPKEPRDNRQQSEVDLKGTPWTLHLDALQKLQAKESKIWRAAALSEFSLDEERDLLISNREDLTDDEIYTMECMIREKDTLSGAYARIGDQSVPQFATNDPVKRAEIVIVELTNISVERQKLTEGILKYINQDEKDVSPFLLTDED